MAWIFYGLTAIGGVVVAVFLLVITLWVVYPWMREKFLYGKRGPDDEWYLRRLKARIDSVGRWCGHEFPILDDASEWLASDAHDDIDSFRERMRRKYKAEAR